MKFIKINKKIFETKEKFALYLFYTKDGVFSIFLSPFFFCSCCCIVLLCFFFKENGILLQITKKKAFYFSSYNVASRARVLFSNSSANPNKGTRVESHKKKKEFFLKDHLKRFISKRQRFILLLELLLQLLLALLLFPCLVVQQWYQSPLTLQRRLATLASIFLRCFQLGRCWFRSS